MKYHKIDMRGNFQVQRLTSSQRGSTSADLGRVVYDTTLAKMFYGDGSGWQEFGTGGGGGSVNIDATEYKYIPITSTTDEGGALTKTQTGAGTTTGTYGLQNFSATDYEFDKVRGLYIRCRVFQTSGGSDEFAKIQCTFPDGVTRTILENFSLNDDDDAGNEIIVLVPINSEDIGNAITLSASCSNNFVGTSASFEILAAHQLIGELALGLAAPVGTILPFSGPDTEVPSHSLLCDGAAVSRFIYSDLFSVIGTTYGIGDGSTTFNLPDLRGRTIIGMDDMGTAQGDAGRINGISIPNRSSDTWDEELGGTAGEDLHQLTEAELAAHDHEYASQVVASGAGATSLTTGTGVVSSSAGSDTPHNNIPPSMAMNYIIIAQDMTAISIGGSGSGSATGLGIEFLPPVLISEAFDTEIPWTTFDASAYVPAGVETVLLAGLIKKKDPDGNYVSLDFEWDEDYRIQVRRSISETDEYTVAWARASAASDQIVGFNQGFYPINSAGLSFQYKTEGKSDGNSHGHQLFLIGYVLPVEPSVEAESTYETITSHDTESLTTTRVAGDGVGSDITTYNIDGFNGLSSNIRVRRIHMMCHGKVGTNGQVRVQAVFPDSSVVDIFDLNGHDSSVSANNISDELREEFIVPVDPGQTDFEVRVLVDAISGTSTEEVSVEIIGADLIAQPSLITGKAILRDEKSLTISGGTPASTSTWLTRDLNTKVLDTVGFVTLASNQFTLTSGDYIIKARCASFRAKKSKIRIQNITDGTTVAEGESLDSDSDDDKCTLFAFVTGFVSISDSKTFEIQHIVQNSATDGFGAPSNFGTKEVYSTVEIDKLA